MNSTPRTSHFLVDSHLMTRTCVAQAQVWRAQRTFHVIACVIFMRSCCVFDSPRLSLPILAVYLLSYRLVHLLSLQLLLPLCGGHIPCALPLMRTLAPLPSTTLSHLGRAVQAAAKATHSLTCGVPDRESNEVKYLRKATELVEAWQHQLQGELPLSALSLEKQR